MRQMQWFALALLLAISIACGSSGSNDITSDAAADQSGADLKGQDSSQSDTIQTEMTTDTVPDSTPDVAPDGSEADDSQSADQSGESDTESDQLDSESDSQTGDQSETNEPKITELKVKHPITTVPTDPLAGGTVKSCAIYQQETCDNGIKKRCSLYDTVNKSYVVTPDPLVHRSYLYSRWYDLYHSPDGQRMERMFKTSPAGDTPESEWGAPENFDRWRDEGDSAIFTGGALTANILRYATTGTLADYQRMEQAVRQMVLFFEVTGIPGYLSRFHFLYLPQGAPKSDQHVFLHEGINTLGIRDFDIPNPKDISGLPQIYLDGVKDSNDKLWTGTPMWHGNPSIDQYSGPWIALPMAFNLLKDDALKKRITHHLTCYLKRLQRIEIHNLQKNTLLLKALQDLLNSGGVALDLDPDDPDISELDTLVMYVLPSYNSESAPGYDMTCPDKMQMTPTRVIDAVSPSWIADAMELAEDLQSGKSARKNGIDHAYIVSLRGGDASHMMQMASVAYLLTGDEQYKTFLIDELIGNLQAHRVARTMGALVSPDWCYSFYADHITIPPHWSLLTVLDVSELKTQMQKVMETEAWQKRSINLRNLKFNLMYVTETPDSIATGKDIALKQALDDLLVFGGNGKDKDGNVVLDSPRRNYTLESLFVADNLPAGINLRCPTEEERTFCEQGITILGAQFGEGTKISYDCPQNPDKTHCVMSDQKCVRKLTDAGTPPPIRQYAGYQWQRSPFELGRHGNGREQAPGIALTEPFWLARFYGLIENGKGQVLAWEPIGSCN